MELPTKLTEISRKMLFKVTVVVKSVDQRHTNETFKTKVFVKKKKKENSHHLFGMLFTEGGLMRDVKHGYGALLTIRKLGCAARKELLGTIRQNIYRLMKDITQQVGLKNGVKSKKKEAFFFVNGGKDTLKAVLSEGQSSVAAGVAFGVAGASPWI